MKKFAQFTDEECEKRTKKTDTAKQRHKIKEQLKNNRDNWDDFDYHDFERFEKFTSRK